MLLFSAAPGPEAGLETLLVQVAQGDRTALAALYRRTKGAVYALALSYLRTHSDAEDITQNTFIRVWEQAGQYSGQGKALSWILAVTRNLSRMELRRRQQQRQLPLGEEHLELPAPEGPVSPEDRQLLQSLLYPFDHNSGSEIAPHCIHRNFHNCPPPRPGRKLLFNSKDLSALVGSAMFADRVGSRGFAAVRTEIRLDSLVGIGCLTMTSFHFRHFSFWNAHFLSPV